MKYTFEPYWHSKHSSYILSFQDLFLINVKIKEPLPNGNQTVYLIYFGALNKLPNAVFSMCRKSNLTGLIVEATSIGEEKEIYIAPNLSSEKLFNYCTKNYTPVKFEGVIAWTTSLEELFTCKCSVCLGDRDMSVHYINNVHGVTVDAKQIGLNYLSLSELKTERLEKEKSFIEGLRALPKEDLDHSYLERKTLKELAFSTLYGKKDSKISIEDLAKLREVLNKNYPEVKKFGYPVEGFSIKDHFTYEI